MSDESNSEALSYGIFGATAFALILPGTLLPQFTARWSMTDREAGLFLFLSFLSSSACSLAARGRLSRTTTLGCAAIAVGIAMLSAASRGCGFAGATLLGGGLGLTMTSVSLLQSRRHAGKRAAELARLNLIWSLGACAAPSLLLRGAAHWTLWPVLLAASALFLALGAAAAFLLREPQAPSVPAVAAATAGAPRATRLPWLLLAIIPLTTGVESSLGGWLSTYSRRAGLLTAGIANTVTCFWLGLLLGRLVFSIPQLAARWQRATLVFAPCLLALSIACLLTLHGAVSLAACALMAGAAVGPLYPLALALRLEHGEAGNLPFLIAGCGAAALPLLTGVVSDATRSLTHGLLVPLWGAAAMALLATMAAAALRGNTDPARSA